MTKEFIHFYKTILYEDFWQGKNNVPLNDEIITKMIPPLDGYETIVQRVITNEDVYTVSIQGCFKLKKEGI